MHTAKINMTDKQYDHETTHELPPLSAGTNLLIHNIKKNNEGWWNKSGIVVEVYHTISIM